MNEEKLIQMKNALMQKGWPEELAKAQAEKIFREANVMGMRLGKTPLWVIERALKFIETQKYNPDVRAN